MTLTIFIVLLVGAVMLAGIYRWTRKPESLGDELERWAGAAKPSPDYQKMIDGAIDTDLHRQ